MRTPASLTASSLLCLALAAGCANVAERDGELQDLHQRLDDVHRQIDGVQTALTQGVRNPHARQMELDRLDALRRESEQLKTRIAQLERP